LIRHFHSQKSSAKEARNETNDYLTGSYGSLGNSSFSKERRKGASEGTTTARYGKILMLAADGMPTERLIESNEVMELVFLTSAAKECTYYNKMLLPTVVCMLD
jgi:hypothetical protein